MKMELHFAGANASDSFHQASRLVPALANGNHVLELRTWRYRKRCLIDRLIACIQFWNDKVACRTEREHPRSKRIVVRSQPSKSGQQSMVLERMFRARI